MTSNKSSWRSIVFITLISLVLWGIVAYIWYILYLWIAPLPLLSILVTLGVLPIPFAIQRAIAKSDRLSHHIARLSSPFQLFVRTISILFVIAVLGLLVPRLITAAYVQPRLFSIETAPQGRVTIIFGAGLMPNGELSPMLKDRVKTAAQLYLAGKTEKLLMSGDNRFVDYNEPEAMRQYALNLGIPSTAMVLDYAGRRTYDTCYRAHYIFGVEQAIVISQRYHIDRAIYTCNGLGIETVGVAAIDDHYFHLIANVREAVATINAFWEVNITHPLPVLGKQEPILFEK